MYNTRRKAEQASIKNRQAQFLAAQKNPAAFNMLKGLFDRTNLLMDYYNRQADLAIASISQSSSYSSSYRGGYHGIGDNCYEFAMRNILDEFSFPYDVVKNPGFTMPDVNYPMALPALRSPRRFAPRNDVVILTWSFWFSPAVIGERHGAVPYIFSYKKPPV